MKPSELRRTLRKLGLKTMIARSIAKPTLRNFGSGPSQCYDQEIERYHGPVTKALLEVNAYLRNPTSGYLGRRFQIYIDVLAPPSQMQSRSYKDDYFVVVTPSPEPQIEQVRHAYLHYVLDPLSLSSFRTWNHDKGLAEYAQRCAGA